MTLSTRVEQRGDQRIFAGHDPAHTAIGASGLTEATPALTPLMLDKDSGKLIVWDGEQAGTAVGVLVLPVSGGEDRLTYWKTGTFATESLIWPADVNEVKKENAFVGSALSHAALP